MSTLNKIIAGNFKKLRKERNLTQKDLAEVLGVKQQAIYYYEKELRQIPTWCLDILCRKFGLPLTYFLENPELENPEIDACFNELPSRLQEAVKIAAKLPSSAQNEIADFIEFKASQNN